MKYIKRFENKEINWDNDFDWEEGFDDVFSKVERIIVDLNG